VLIDWFTVFAQIVNFLILVALLRHFLYGRILKAMEGRQKRIIDELAEAERMKTEAEAEAQTYRRKNLELENNRESMLAAVKKDADAQRNDLMAKAREEIDETRARWRASLRRDQKEFLSQLRRRAADEVIRISQKALQDLGNASLEQSVAEVFLAKLRSLDGATWDALRKALRADTGGSLLVRTAFPLSEELRRAIESLLREKLPESAAAAFETAEGKMWGIELRGGGHRVGWTLEDHLEDLESALTAELAQVADRTQA
jgi:F-type H+-transporting ATPase subunit b